MAGAGTRGDTRRWNAEKNRWRPVAEPIKDAGRTAREYVETGREAIKSGMETGKERSSRAVRTLSRIPHGKRPRGRS